LLLGLGGLIHVRRHPKMNRYFPWRLLCSVVVAVVVTAAGVELFRMGVIESQSTALWPAFDLLHLGSFEGPMPTPMLLFFISVQVVIWTAFLYIGTRLLPPVRSAIRSCLSSRAA